MEDTAIVVINNLHLCPVSVHQEEKEYKLICRVYYSTLMNMVSPL